MVDISFLVFKKSEKVPHVFCFNVTFQHNLIDLQSDHIWESREI